jgi:hypothetical protein
MILAYLVLASLLVVAAIQGILFYEYNKNKLNNSNIKWSIYVSLIILAIAVLLTLIMIVAKKL